MNEGLTGLEWHGGEQLMTEFQFLGELTLLISILLKEVHY